MKVKLQHKLQPSEHPAHSVIIEDNAGNPIFVALQLEDQIIYAEAGEPDFHAMLKALGVDKTVVVTEVKPKPIQDMIWTP